MDGPSGTCQKTNRKAWILRVKPALCRALPTSRLPSLPAARAYL